MPEPPERRTPPILLMRPAYEWISRLNQKQRTLAELSTKQREGLDRWVEIEFVYSALKLDGASIERERIMKVASLMADAKTVAESDRQVMSLLESLRTVTALARAKGKAAELTADLLVELHGASDAGAIGPAKAVDQTLAMHVLSEHKRLAVDAACRWFAADSFTELHPIEQASIAFLRLIDISPFEQANQQTALVGASLFTLRGELPPIVIQPEMNSMYRAAIEEGTRMNTRPMVELVAEAVERTISQLMKALRD